MQTNTILFEVYNHIVNIHEKKPCTICGEMFGTNFMNKHILSKHRANNEMKHKCSFCGKHFLTRQKFKDHVNIHTGEKPYMCKFCGATFASRGNWRMHEKTVHLGYKRGMKIEKITV